MFNTEDNKIEIYSIQGNIVRFRYNGESYSDYVTNGVRHMPVNEDAYGEYLFMAKFLDDDSRFMVLSAEGVTDMSTTFTYKNVEMGMNFDSYNNGDLEIVYSDNPQTIQIAREGAAIMIEHIKNLGNGVGGR